MKNCDKNCAECELFKHEELSRRDAVYGIILAGIMLLLFAALIVSGAFVTITMIMENCK